MSRGSRMHVEVSTDNTIDGSEVLTSQIVAMIQHELAHFADHITRVEVHLSDANADKSGPNDMHCVLEARLENHQPTVVKETAATLEQATKGAAGKMKRSLESSLGKLSDRR
jgi:hypothetical protein